MPTPSQFRAARAAMGLTQQKVADGSGLHVQQVKFIENGGLKKEQTTSTARLTDFYNMNGYEFTAYDGIRKKPDDITRIFTGGKGFNEFMVDVYDTSKEGGDICVTHVDEDVFDRWHGDYRDTHLSRMASIKDLTFRIIAQKGHENLAADGYAQYRYVEPEYFSGVPTYVYGNKTAHILFTENDVTVIVTENAALADAQRKSFDLLWVTAIE